MVNSCLFVSHCTEQGTRHFGASNLGPLTVETTSYALLAQIVLGEIDYSYPIVLWLMEQRNQIGNWYSTQVCVCKAEKMQHFPGIWAKIVSKTTISKYIPPLRISD